MINLKSLKQSWLSFRYDKSSMEKFLIELSILLNTNSKIIIQANQKDLDLLDKSDYKYPRLILDQNKIDSMIKSLEILGTLDARLGETFDTKNLPNGLTTSKVKTAIGLIAVIYESRPNVTIDVACLCLLSGNGCILKGGKEAWNTNLILVELIHKAMISCNIDTNLITLVDSDKSQMKSILKAKGIVDLIIPRGSKNLIEYVTKTSRVPVIETGASPVHLYVDEVIDETKAVQVIINSKTQNTSACNSLDTLLINESELTKLKNLPSELSNKQIQIHCTKKDYKKLDKLGYQNLKLGTNKIFDEEYLSLNVNIKITKGIDEAISHIQKHSLGHSESIISSNQSNINKFQNSIDSGCIFVNTPTCFADGFEFGLGSEIGISTQKLHARGPMGLESLTTYKWVITSNFSIRK